MKPPSSLTIAVEDDSASSQAETEASFRGARTPSPRSQPPQKKREGVAEVTCVLTLMFIITVVSAIELACRLRKASKWAGLMEMAGFEHWPSLGGSKAQILACVVSIAASGVAFIILKCLLCARRPVGVRVVTPIILAAVVAAAISLVAVMIGTPGLTDAMIKDLAVQTGPATAFNRDFCQAWCRHAAAGLRPLLNGECGEDKATVFDDVFSYFLVGDWCKEAIAQQNYEVIASHSGISPVASLKGAPRLLLSSTVFPNLLSVVNGLLGLGLLYAWIGVISGR